METISHSVGHEDDADLAQALHELDHAGHVERIYLGESLIGRRRFKAVGDKGNEYGIILDSDPSDVDGKVLVLEKDRAVILYRGEPKTMVLRARDVAAGVQLGWHAGHLHWRVRFEGDILVVLLDGSREEYLARISRFVEAGAIEVLE